MKRLKIMKVYFLFWLFIYFIIFSNAELVWIYFSSTLTFNIAVMTVLGIGVVIIMTSTIQLVNLAGTFGILAYKKGNLDFYLAGIEKIMPANIAHMFHSRARKQVLMFTQDESREVISWLDEKFANQKTYINFFIGTALMIGLFGTFTGLLKSIDEMGRIILSLSGDIDIAKVIGEFAGPLGGMAIGFGSSLFGVASAIILGVKGYILSRNQEQFIVGVEDWLKGRIIESGGAGEGTGLSMGGGADTKGSFMSLFTDKFSDLNNNLQALNNTNEQMRIELNDSLKLNNQSSQESNRIMDKLAQTVSKMSMEKSEELLGTVSATLSIAQEKMDREREVIEEISDLNKKHSKNVHAQIDLLNETLESIEVKLTAEDGKSVQDSLKMAVSNITIKAEVPAEVPAEVSTVQEAVSVKAAEPISEKKEKPPVKKEEGQKKYNDLFGD